MKRLAKFPLPTYNTFYSSIIVSFDQYRTNERYFIFLYTVFKMLIYYSSVIFPVVLKTLEVSFWRLFCEYETVLPKKTKKKHVLVITQQERLLTHISNSARECDSVWYFEKWQQFLIWHATDIINESRKILCQNQSECKNNMLDNLAKQN